MLFAPPSITTTGFFIVGKVTAIAGLSIPGILPKPNKLDAIAAPVEPAATRASELPVATAFTVKTIEEYLKRDKQLAREKDMLVEQLREVK